MKRHLTLFVPLFLFLAASGCNHPEDHPAATPAPAAAATVNTTAIVDLEKLFTDIGWAQELKINVENLNNQFNDSLKKDQESYKEQIKQVRDRIAGIQTEQLTEQQRQFLDQMTNSAQVNLNTLHGQANQELQLYRADCVKQYRDAISPTIREVAEAKKLTIVFAKAENVLYNDGAVDITDAVVDAARTRPPTLHPVPMPKPLPEPGPLVSISNTTQPSTNLVAPSTTRP